MDITPTFQVVPEATMRWKCIDCLHGFQGPTNRAPKNGCPKCCSRNVIDINVATPTPRHPYNPFRRA